MEKERKKASQCVEFSGCDRFYHTIEFHTGLLDCMDDLLPRQLSRGGATLRKVFQIHSLLSGPCPGLWRDGTSSGRVRTLVLGL